ncbi:ChrR family anti-sigma-E factor [Azorhizobium caulinodans]|uniref:ChrR family anti-sigma-E factor n=1 Tax=Azorhizobium caulinodans TaxID=7 RepID=UPI0002D7BEEE|nr:ChrR family anti-sigma-E factor [Azorhizobium caulinodans]
MTGEDKGIVNGRQVLHHPSDETLLAYAAGRLEVGPAVVTQSHLAFCSHCRERLRVFAAAGGALLDALPPTEMSDAALIETQARADAPAPPPPRSRPARRQPADVDLPSVLGAYDFGRWRWLGPGVKARHILLPGHRFTGARLLRIAPGSKIPEHGHTGTEFTQVIHGSFSDGHQDYRPGDFCEADSALDHEPVAGPEGDCICVAAIEGSMRFSGVIGRLMQPFVGF